MANQELIDYIKQVKNQGYTLDQIKSSLIQKGWNQADIDAAISSMPYLQQELKKQAQSHAKEPSSNKSNFFQQLSPGKIIIISIMGLLVIFSLFLITRKIFKNIAVEQRKDEIIQQGIESIQQERQQESVSRLLKGRVISTYACQGEYCIDIIEDITQQQITLLLSEQIEDPQYPDLTNMEISTECVVMSETSCRVKNPRRVSIQLDKPIDDMDYLGPS